MLTLQNSMDCSRPGFPVPHCLLEFAWVHVHWISDAIQPSHPLSPSSLSAFNLAKHLSHSFLLLLLLSRFSHVRLLATPWTAAHQAPPSLGFSRQEHRSRLPFPSPVHESESEVTQSCPTLSDPMDCSLPGSPVPGIFQARVLEWGGIAFSFTLSVCLKKSHFLKI